MHNLFTDVSKHLSKRNEDFLTNSFVSLVNFPLENEKALGIGLLNFLCFTDPASPFVEEEVLVTCQKVTDEGTPDIEVRSSDKRIFVEVKHDSGLGIRQIERYRKTLEEEKVPIKRIVLLTKFSLDFPTGNQNSIPDKHIRWYHVHQFLEGLRPLEKVSEFLLGQFIEFLEDKQMAIQRITWEYTNGMRAFLNLVNMIGAAIEELGIKIYQKTAGWEWRGFYLEGKDEFCGIYFEELDSVYLFRSGLPGYKPKEKGFSFPFYEEDGGTYFELSLEDAHFFALQKENQLNILKKFISTCHTEARKIGNRDS